VTLNPCRYCKASHAMPDEFEDGGRTIGIVCLVCGARGPLRPLLHSDAAEAVAEMAAADWNRANSARFDFTDLEWIESADKAAAETSAELRKTPSTEPAAHSLPPTTHRVKNNNGQAPDVGGKPAKPKKKGTRGDVRGTETQQLTVAARLKVWFKAHETNPDKAVKRERINLGASAATLYHILSGKHHMSQVTLDSITAALDAIEAKSARAPLPPAEIIPNKFAPITGVNPLPKLTAPPRCASTG